MTSKIHREILKEKILKYPMKEEIHTLIEKSIHILIYGEMYFGELQNGDLMVQIIKETLNISLKHRLKDGNKRTAWFFFLFAIQFIYRFDKNKIMEEDREKILSEMPFLMKVNDIILEVSDKGNNNSNVYEIALDLCDDFREQIGINNLTKYRGEGNDKN